MQRRYLVTGGAGFIGSHIVEALLKRGDAVAILDDFSTGKKSNLDAALKARSPKGPEPRVFEGDLRDAALVRQALAGVTHVLHQAALPSVPRSVAEPFQSHEVNATGTLSLLLAARDAGVRRFVYASSSSAYGDAPTLPKVESQPTAPLSPYAVSKLAGEQYCRIVTPLYGLETVSLRYFNIFGPRQDPESQYAAVIPKFVTAVNEGKSPVVYGDGKQSRDFTYIDNAVQANLLACDAPSPATGLAYNVACGASATLLEVLDLIGRILNKPVKPVHEPPRAGDVKHSLASIDLARRHLSFEPSVGLEEGLRRTVAAFTG
jgi:nucleoside-diphosphate-sugar epimerase